MMKYRVQVFASLKDAVGAAEWLCESKQQLSGEALQARFFSEFPQVAGLHKITRLACNQTFIRLDQVLKPEDELALIPPVSGG